MNRPLCLALLLALAACTDAAPAPLDTATPAVPAPNTRTLIVGVLGAPSNAGWAPDWSGYQGTSHGCLRSYSVGRFAIEPPLEEGDRLQRLTVAATGNLSTRLDVYEMSAAPDGTATIGTIASLGAVMAAWRDYTIDLGGVQVSGGAAHWFELAADGAGACVGAVRVTIER